MLSLAYPLVLIVGIPALALLMLSAKKRRADRALPMPLDVPGGSPFRSPVSMDAFIKALSVLELIGALCLLVAASGPRRLDRDSVWLERGADIVFILDVSPSMSARDMGDRSRFEMARDLVRSFAQARSADSVGLVAVGEAAALLVPPTVDRSTLLARLETLRIAELGDGTALGMGLSIAALHLSASTAPRKIAVMVSDGENNAGEINPATAAGALRDIGANLWVIGLGTMGEVMVDYVDPATSLRRTGLFNSRYDPEALKRIADAGGGTYVSAPSVEAFVKAFESLDETERRVSLSRQTVRAVPRQAPFLIAGLLLVLIVRALRRIALGAFL